MSDKEYNILLTASDKTKAAFESASGNIEKMTGGLVNLQRLVGAVSVGALVELVHSTAEADDQMGKAAQSVGTTTEALSRLNYAASLSDVPFEDLRKGLEKLSKAAYDATTIGGTLALSFEQMGIKTADSNGKIKDSSVIMSEVADKFSHMEDGSTKTALAMSLFGKAGAAMIPLLNQGSAGLKEMADEADNLGVTISSNTSVEAERFNDNLTRMHAAGTGMANQLTSALLPALNEVTAVFVSTSKDTEAMSGAADVAAFAFRALASAGAVIVYDFKVAGDSIGAVAAALTALAHGDYAGVKEIGKQLKEQIAQAATELVDFEERLAHPPVPPAIEARKSTFTPEIDDQTAKVALDKILAASKSFDEAANIAHDDAFNKWLAQWTKIEDQLTAEGAKGTKAREAHEAAGTVYVMAENVKRLDAAVKLSDAVMKSEKDYFSKLQTMADDATGTAMGREKKRYDLQRLDLEKHHKDTIKAIGSNHEQLLAEEEAYQTALGNIKQIHQENQLGADVTVAAMAHAFSAGNKEEEISSTAAYFEKLSSFGASHNHAMFELNKVASVATAVMNTYKGVSGVLAEFPGPLGWGMAAAQAAMGMAQVAAIESTSFGGGAANAGGAGIPSMATSPGVPVAPTAAAAPVAAPVQAPQNVFITIAGDTKSSFSYDQIVNELIPTLNQAAGNGVNIQVTLAPA